MLIEWNAGDESALDRLTPLVYDELRRHYQLHLTEAAAEQGVSQIKIQVLEALLRLRQAACHPVLVDATKA